MGIAMSGTSDGPKGIVLTEEQKRKQRGRSIAIALALLALVLLIYAYTWAVGPGVLNRPL
jgi:hypothetical protein